MVPIMLKNGVCQVHDRKWKNYCYALVIKLINVATGFVNCITEMSVNNGAQRWCNLDTFLPPAGQQYMHVVN